MAVLKVKVGEQYQIAAGEGNGPVNALDIAPAHRAGGLFIPTPGGCAAGGL